MRYKAVCEDGDYETHSYIVKSIPEKFAEEHMMKTGHIVNVVETEVI